MKRYFTSRSIFTSTTSFGFFLPSAANTFSRSSNFSSWNGASASFTKARTSPFDLSAGAITRSVMTFDCAISTFAFGSGGRLISSACGFRNTVVHMKKMRSRNATSTIGVMSIFTPRRFGLRRLSPPFFFPGLLSGVSTAPMEGRSFSYAKPASRSVLQRGLAARDELGNEAECDRVGLLHDRHHVFHGAVFGFLVCLDRDTKSRISAPLLQNQVLEARHVGFCLSLLPDRPKQLVVLGDGQNEYVRFRHLQVRVTVRQRDGDLLRRVELRGRHEKDQEQECHVDHE